MNKKAAAKETSSESESKPTSDSQPPAPESTTATTTTTTKSNETNKSSAATKSAKKTQEAPSLSSSTSGSPSTNEQSSAQLVAPHQHQLAHHPQPYLNYYPYPNVPLDVNTAASWPQAMAAATMAMATACGNADPLAVAAYMNYPPPDLAAAVQYQDQFTYGFTPAYSFGYNTADYAPVSGATPNPTLWTPAAAAATFVPSTTSPLNQAKPASDAVSSSTSTSSSVPVQQDPLLIAQHMNDLSAQQISPVYAPQSTYKQHYHQHNGNGHHHYRNSYNSDVSYMNRLAAQQQSLVPAPLPLQYYHYNNNPKQNGYYDEFSSFQYDGQSSGAKMSSYKRSAKNKSNYSAKQNAAGHAQSTTNEFKNSNTNEFVNTELMSSEEMSNGSGGSGALAKSDSKTWASIVGVQNKSQNGPGQQQQQPQQQQQQPNKSTSPSNSAASSSSNQQQQTEQQPTQFQSYNGNYKNAYPSRNKPFKKYSKQSFNNNNNSNTNQEAQQYVEFNLNNGAFPPISINCKFFFFFLEFFEHKFSRLIYEVKLKTV